jgi:hypothetical protein
MCVCVCGLLAHCHLRFCVFYIYYWMRCEINLYSLNKEQENNKKTPVLFLAGFLLLTTCAFHTHIPFHPHTAHTVTDIARNFVICFFLSFLS